MRLLAGIADSGLRAVLSSAEGRAGRSLRRLGRWATRRGTLRGPGTKGNEPVRLTVHNGKEEVTYGAANGQVNIHGRSGTAVTTLRDFANTRSVPNAKVRDERLGPTIQVHRDGNRTTIDWKLDAMRQRTVVNEATAFVARRALDHPAGTRECWQFGPRTYPNGATLPRVSVEVSSSKERINAIWIRTLESVDFDAPVQPETFLVAVPPGTLILDDRGNRPGGRDDVHRGVTTGPVVDVVAYADAIAERRRPAAPPKVAEGDIAPRLQLAAWVNGAPPKLEGKVVLIDFWGGTCGPCVAALPQVREAARHFAGTDLVVVGLNDSGGGANRSPTLPASGE